MRMPRATLALCTYEYCILRTLHASPMLRIDAAGLQHDQILWRPALYLRVSQDARHLLHLGETKLCEGPLRMLWRLTVCAPAHGAGVSAPQPGARYRPPRLAVRHAGIIDGSKLQWTPYDQRDLR